MKFSIKNSFSKCDQICSFLRIWLRLLKKSLMENFIFCAVKIAFTETNKTNIRHLQSFFVFAADQAFFDKFLLKPEIASLF